MAINNILWKGVSSNLISGLLISELPDITVPPIRFSETVIDGRDGSIIEELGYGSYDKTITIGLYGHYDLNAVISYFSGEGNLVLSNEPNHLYKAKIVSQIDFKRLVSFKTATVKFRVQPHKFKYPADVYSTASSTLTVVNFGNCVAKPKITIQGSGTVALSVDNVSVFSYAFPTGETSVTIDCEKEDAFNSSGLRNRYMTGEFPQITVGSHTIAISGTLTALTVENASRWL